MHRCYDGESDVLQQSFENQTSNISSMHNYATSPLGQPTTPTSENNGNYLDPIRNNDDEVNRLHLMHYMVRYGWEGNFSAPVHQTLKAGKAKILDIGYV
jgi:hypothetical protein